VWPRRSHPPIQEATGFQCPACGAQYKVVRIEAAPMHDRQIVCVNCGAPLLGRQGKFVLKYFRTKGGREIMGRRV
jgi:predicted RNA-binding Zn-ribbon protein involved in translation (DUF1610 family)